MRKHYWELPIFMYLFLGGLGGGIMFLSMIFSGIVYPNNTDVTAALWFPMFVALACLAVGCFFLVFELGQPLSFIYVFTNSTKSVIGHGARLLLSAMLFGFVWWIAWLPTTGPFSFLAGGLPFFQFLQWFSGPCMLIAGLCGLCIMMYTGIMLSTLKAHSFWATPALPVLFTVSALSTACAAIMLSVGLHPEMGTAAMVEVIEEIRSYVHTSDIFLILVEMAVLLTMILSFLGAGNNVQNKVAHRWVHGSYAIGFWGGMICVGLGIPLLLNLFGSGVATHVVAPVLALCGGCLLRALCVYSDDRAEVPGEDDYFTRLYRDAPFMRRWKYGENEF